MERAWIDTVDEYGASSELRELYDRVRDPHTGVLDNVMAVHSLHPQGLEAHFDLYVAVMRGTSGLAARDREMIALVVSVANGCHY